MLHQALDYVDGLLDVEASTRIRRHLADCPDCAARLEHAASMQSALRTLPSRRVPMALTTSLRVIASRELARQRRWRGMAQAYASVITDLKLWFNNLWRPIALPFAGGLMTSSLLFSMIVSSYPLRGHSLEDDVPTVLYTEATFKSMVPIEFSDDDLIVELMVGDEGRVLDYRIVGGGSAQDPKMRGAMTNLMLFSEFRPATAFGQPVHGRIRVSFRRGHIDVRG
ncbi:MAG: zf-HC2 domain-containing protein [Acidobacteria bacterium]|nr:zf-HC2 domain-containing protein [Acidobacteriota bacterium]